MKQRTLSDPDYVAIIAALRRAREERGVTQRALAADLGQRQSFVAKYETCERRLDVIDLLRVCKVLGVPVRDVLPEAWRGGL